MTEQEREVIVQAEGVQGSARRPPPARRSPSPPRLRKRQPTPPTSTR
jgi:hypothetical protein